MNIIYNKFLANVINQSVNIETDEFKIILVNDAYIPDAASTDTYMSLVTGGYEAVGEGYTAGGKNIRFIKDHQDESRIYYRSYNVSWTNSTITARYAIVYRVTDGLLACCYDWGEVQSTEEGTFLLSWTGTYSLTVDLNTGVSGGGTVVDVDDELSTSSTNPLTNRKTTSTFGELGVALGGEAVPNALYVLCESGSVAKKNFIYYRYDEVNDKYIKLDPQPAEGTSVEGYYYEKVDRIDNISDSQIEDMFK